MKASQMVLFKSNLSRSQIDVDLTSFVSPVAVLLAVFLSQIH